MTEKSKHGDTGLQRMVTVRTIKEVQITSWENRGDRIIALFRRTRKGFKERRNSCIEPRSLSRTWTWW